MEYMQYFIRENGIQITYSFELRGLCVETYPAYMNASHENVSYMYALYEEMAL